MILKHLYTTICFIFICSCCYSQTQSQMNYEAELNYKKADSILNSVYKNILKAYQKDTIFITKLKQTQRIWISYRDAELEMKYPLPNKRKEYGSVYPMCASLYLEELTKERIGKLKLWLSGKDETDVCNGSVKNF